MSENDVTQDAETTDVSQPGTHSQVQCADVRLVSSHLEPIQEDAAGEGSRFEFKIDATIDNDIAYSRLSVKVISQDDSPGQSIGPYELLFTLEGIFTADGEIQPGAMENFARMYTLSILWPYAREYTADQLRRVGQSFLPLPIINPQVVTERLIKAGIITIHTKHNEDTISANTQPTE